MVANAAIVLPWDELVPKQDAPPFNPPWLPQATLYPGEYVQLDNGHVDCIIDVSYMALLGDGEQAIQEDPPFIHVNIFKEASLFAFHASLPSNDYTGLSEVLQTREKRWVSGFNIVRVVIMKHYHKGSNILRSIDELHYARVFRFHVQDAETSEEIPFLNEQVPVILFSSKILLFLEYIHGEFRWMLCWVSQAQKCTASISFPLPSDIWDWIKLQFTGLEPIIFF